MDYFLTKREHEILLILIDGDSNKSISNKLKISVRTVETILYYMFIKTDSKSRLDLTVKYLKFPEAFRVKKKPPMWEAENF